eukprot:scaffold8755_cov46-Phaeocystis_antarctica.AAC.1
MAASSRERVISRGRAPRPRAAASAEAPASPVGVRLVERKVTAGSAPAPSPSASRCTPSGPVVGSMRNSFSSAGSTEPSVPSNDRSAAVRPLPFQEIVVASRSSLQLRSPSLWHNPRDQPSAAAAAPASPSAAHCWRCSRPRRGPDRARCTAGRRGCAARHRSASTAPSRCARPRWGGGVTQRGLVELIGKYTNMALSGCHGEQATHATRRALLRALRAPGGRRPRPL